LARVRLWSFGLATIGAILCAVGVAPVSWIERGRLPPFDAGWYLGMMIAPAVAVAIVLVYQWNIRVDRASSIALIVLGIGTGLYPFWGPPIWPAMTMRLDWIGTILSMYLPGVLIAAAGLLQLRLSASEQLGRRSRSATLVGHQP
jgi:hypothetical protein